MSRERQWTPGSVQLLSKMSTAVLVVGPVCAFDRRVIGLAECGEHFVGWSPPEVLRSMLNIEAAAGSIVILRYGAMVDHIRPVTIYEILTRAVWRPDSGDQAVVLPACRLAKAVQVATAKSHDTPKRTSVSAPSDPEEVLGLKPGFSLDDVKAARRSLAKRLHPDGAPAWLVPTCEECLKTVNVAADQLETRFAGQY